MWDYCVFISLVWLDLYCIDIVSVIDVNNITRKISNVSCVITVDTIEAGKTTEPQTNK